MSSLISRAITVRLKNDRIEYLGNEGSRSAYLEKIIDNYRKIETICMWMDISVEEFCEKMYQKFLDGEITKEDFE